MAHEWNSVMAETERPPRRGGLELQKRYRNINPSGGLDVVDSHFAGSAVLGGVEGDLLAFHEVAHAGTLQGRRMDEHVLAAVARLNEAEALLRVVELYGAHGHRECPCLLSAREQSGRAEARPVSSVVDVWRERLNVRPSKAQGSTARLSGQMSIDPIWCLKTALARHNPKEAILLTPRRLLGLSSHGV